MQDAEHVTLALDWYEAGMDFADALHLASSSDLTAFATFDKKISNKANKLNISPQVNHATLARRKWIPTPARGNQKYSLVQRIRGINGLVCGGIGFKKWLRLIAGIGTEKGKTHFGIAKCCHARCRTRYPRTGLV